MRISRLLRRLSGSAGSRPAGGDYSLFGEILDWMLAPLLFLWPISIILTYDVASHIANQPYDQALADQVRAISRQVGVQTDGKVRLDLSTSASRLLRSDTEDTIYYQIIAPDGRFLAGDTEIPGPDEEQLAAPGRILFRDADIRGEDIRVATLVQPVRAEQPTPYMLIQVAETRHKRTALSSRIVSGVLLPQFAIIPLAVLLVWFGLSRGIAPLGALQAMIRDRRSGDLSPIAPESVPEEVRPLVVAFNDMMMRLDALLHAQQRFIADAAHQMRTPLAGLKMQIELAKSENDPQQMRESMQRAWLGAERATRLINQLLSLARADASSEKVHVFATVDMARVIRDAVSDCVPLALRKGIELVVDVPESVMLQGNDVLLGELVSNLVDNAIKYTGAGGQVVIALRGHPAEMADSVSWVFSVTDNGPGIPPEEREKVFRRFYRVLGVQAEGSGLGLAIVREVAELHAGSLHLLDNPAGRGLRVEIAFPPQSA